MQFIKLDTHCLAVNLLSGFECVGSERATIDFTLYGGKNEIRARNRLSFRTDGFWEIYFYTSLYKTEKGAMILSQIEKITNDLAYKIERDFLSVLKNVKEPYVYDYNQRLKEFENCEEAIKIKELVKDFVKTYHELSFFRKIALRLWF